MKNKVLISVYLPSLNETYELFISTNETIYKNTQLIIKIIEEFSDCDFSNKIQNILVDPVNCKAYDNMSIVKDTDIRNGKLILLI